jgi:hypothetical protein
MLETSVGLARAALALPFLLLAAGSCSGKSERDSNGDGGEAGVPSAGTSGDGGLAGRGTSSAGTGGASAGSAGTSGGAGSANGGAGTSGTSAGGSGGSTANSGCAGVFGAAVLQFSGSDQAIPQSLSVAGDDLELFYVEYRIATNHLFVRKRASRSERFGAATELPAALSAFCPTPATTPSIDVTDDGLRLYLTCVPDSETGEAIAAGPIRMAERADRNSEFALLPDAVGVAWTSISVSPDELSLLTSDLSDVDFPITLVARRAKRSEPFGLPERLASVDNQFWHPEFALDSLHVFGSLQQNRPGILVSMTRTEPLDSFSRPSTDGMPVAPVEPAPTTNSLLTPTLSADCRSIHFLQLRHGEADTYSFDVYSARR